MIKPQDWKPGLTSEYSVFFHKVTNIQRSIERPCPPQTSFSGRRMAEENKTKPPDFSTKVFDKVLLISAFHGPLAE